MCGLNGALRLTNAAPPLCPQELLRVRDAMASRGPDGAGEWLSPDGRVAFGHRRLAIIDLSEAGRQPMPSADGRHTIVFNGEIYNYRELRSELEAAGVAFRSHSDTEVILALYARAGREGFGRLRGMFALALWDAPAERLVLARDPYGIKPLYYGIADGVLRFASQVKALGASGVFSREPSAGALAGLCLWGSVPEPFSALKDVRAVPPGHVLEFGPGGARVLAPVPQTPLGAPAPEDAVEDSVAAHLVSDVPVGIFLSAGLDSALVAALAARRLAEKPVALTLAFEALAGTPDDEAPLASRVARLLGCRHVERRLGPAELEALRPEALRAMDQPSIDGFNTFLVSRAARDAGLKVALSGLGGDELFGSYPSFRDVPRWNAWARRAAHVPGLRWAWPRLAAVLAPERPKLRGLLEHGRTLAGAYLLRRAVFLPEELPGLLGPEFAALGLAAYDALADAEAQAPPEISDWEAVHNLESALYMRNQLLRDTDWASMAHGVEVRVPLVDARLRAALAAARFEPARSDGKAALVRRLAPELPPELFTRPKTGFVVPDARPQRGGLPARDAVRTLLAPLLASARGKAAA